jgi:hypothetical protein
MQQWVHNETLQDVSTEVLITDFFLIANQTHYLSKFILS